MKTVNSFSSLLKTRLLAIRAVLLLALSFAGLPGYAQPNFQAPPASPDVGTWVSVHISGGPAVSVLVVRPGIGVFPAQLEYEDTHYFDPAVRRVSLNMDSAAARQYVSDVEILLDQIAATEDGASQLHFLGQAHQLIDATGGDWGTPNAVFLNADGRNSGINVVIGMPDPDEDPMNCETFRLDQDAATHGRGSASILYFGNPRQSDVVNEYDGQPLYLPPDVELFHENQHVVRNLGGFARPGWEQMQTLQPLFGPREGELELSDPTQAEELVVHGGLASLMTANGYSVTPQHQILLNPEASHQRAIEYAEDIRVAIELQGGMEGAVAAAAEVERIIDLRRQVGHLSEDRYARQRGLQPLAQYWHSAVYNPDALSVYEVVNFSTTGLSALTQEDQRNPSGSLRLGEVALTVTPDSCSSDSSSSSSGCAGSRVVSEVPDEVQAIQDAIEASTGSGVTMGGYHRIRTLDSALNGKVVEANDLTIGAAVNLQPVAPAQVYRPTQEWQWVITSKGTLWRLRNTNLCLDVDANDYLMLGTCDASSTRQLWEQPTTVGQIRNVGRNRCMDVAYENTGSGSAVGVYDCKSGSNPWNQRFGVDYIEHTARLPVSNVARQSLAAQSSDYEYIAQASEAVDGNTNGAYQPNSVANSVTHTNADEHAWLIVELGDPVPVHAVTLYPRTDCCQGRLSDYWIVVSERPIDPELDPATQWTQTGVKYVKHVQTTLTNATTFTLPYGTKAMHVMVQLNGTDFLSLAEVVVIPSSGIFDATVLLPEDGKSPHWGLKTVAESRLVFSTQDIFNVIENGDGTILLRHGSKCAGEYDRNAEAASMGDCVVSTSDSANSTRWRPVPVSGDTNGAVTLRDENGRCLDLEGGSSAGRLLPYSCHNDWNQKWQISIRGDSR